MAAGTLADYTKVYWVEAFQGIMSGDRLDQEDFKRYAKVLIAHTLSNNVLRDRRLHERNHYEALVDDFYKEYQATDLMQRNVLLTKSVFMRTLVDIDPARLEANNKEKELSKADKEYLDDVALKNALKAKNLERFLDNEEKRVWLSHYGYARTAPKTIEYNVKIYQALGRVRFDQFVEQELYISTGTKDLTLGILTEGWYTQFGLNRFSLADVKSLRDTLEDPSKLNGSTHAKVGHVFFQYRLLQTSLPENLRDMYWKCKISNLTTFINQISAANAMTESKKP